MELICDQDNPLEEELQEEELQEEEKKEEVVSAYESFESRSADSDFDMEEEEEMPTKKVKRMMSYTKPVTRRSARIMAEAKAKQQSTITKAQTLPTSNPSPVKMTDEEAAQILITLKVYFF